MLKREISEKLISWKNQKKKKALCIIGARQIGKTTNYPRVCERAVRILC